MENGRINIKSIRRRKVRNLKLTYKDNKGFTLIEMIVTIVILGLLLAILIPGLIKYIEKAKDKQLMVNARSAYLAVQADLFEAIRKNDVSTFMDVILEYQTTGVAGLNSSDIEGIPEAGTVIMDIKSMYSIGIYGNSIDENTGEILAMEYREGIRYIQYVKAKGWTDVKISP